MNRFDGSKTRFHQQLDFSLIAKTRENAAHTGRVFPGQQQPTRFGKGVFEVHGLSESAYPRGNFCPVELFVCSDVVVTHFVVQEVGARIGRQGIEHALLHGRPPRHRHLEHRQCRGDRDVMVHEIRNHVVHRPALNVELGVERRLLIGLFVGAGIRLLPRKEFCIHEQPMLEIVDPQLCCLAEADRTEMTGDLGAALVSRRDRSRQFRRCNEHVRLEIIDSFIQPVIHRVGRVLRPF